MISTDVDNEAFIPKQDLLFRLTKVYKQKALDYFKSHREALAPILDKLKDDEKPVMLTKDERVLLCQLQLDLDHKLFELKMDIDNLGSLVKRNQLTFAWLYEYNSFELFRKCLDADLDKYTVIVYAG